ncbi:MAG: hypothetical protein GY906_35645 [bacterium]|nr:hypothetical protein [bacterium]
MTDRMTSTWADSLKLMPNGGEWRSAIIEDHADDIAIIAAYLPRNYRARVAYAATRTGRAVVIIGRDNAGWTLNDYVIPRLASGLYFAREIGADN